MAKSRATSPPAANLRAIVSGRRSTRSLSFAHALEELRRGFTDAHAWLANVPAANGNDAVLPHGVFGPLNHREWVAFMFFHLGMHADQVKGIRSGVGFPAT
ncbi:DinB family protein [Candidatus Amarobacter glycogenicus]|uniref:DinB family protein n=1 Tax=Candidatus Amarobacter glycogenicus TaxID=3140699 RepID=UPI0031358F1E|nr:DinB family protein [Dehalococcoidia bacterium]